MLLVKLVELGGHAGVRAQQPKQCCAASALVSCQHKAPLFVGLFSLFCRQAGNVDDNQRCSGAAMHFCVSCKLLLLLLLRLLALLRPAGSTAS
jgi:hypothetical protein